MIPKLFLPLEIHKSIAHAALGQNILRVGDRIEVESEEDDGNVARLITEAARRLACDTIVIGRRAHSMVGHLLAGGVAGHLLRSPIGRAVWVVQS